MAFLFWPADDTALPFMQRLRRTLLILPNAKNMVERLTRPHLTRTLLNAFVANLAANLMPATWQMLRIPRIPRWTQYGDSDDDELSDIMGSDSSDNEQ